jgi:murein DD-endopeptidase MepM/ murein hydrolase activator NlpD
MHWKVEFCDFLHILAVLNTKQISQTMPEAKHPRGVTFTRDYLLSILLRHTPSQRLLATCTIAALTTMVILKSAAISGWNEQWADLTSQSPAPVATLASANSPISPAPLESQPAAPQQPAWLNEQVKSGDTLSQIFKRAGFNDQDVDNVIRSADGKSLQRLFPGQTISFLADDFGILAGVRHVKSQLETVTYLASDHGFESHVEARTPEMREAWTTGVITSSLFVAGKEAGLSQSMILDMANIFGGVVDFALDPRRGDTMQLVYEEFYVNGEKYKDGAIIAASFTNHGETFNAFRYTDANGDTNYYNEDGVSMRKSFLMAPLDFTRVSSDFDMHRMHPILNITRPHRGTDYAAPIGTPVYAAGDGRVASAGYNSSQGNFVILQHGDQYMTKYLHLQKRMVNAGQHVSQSQVIGTVGSTGLATGPHLHYEFLVNGVNQNPRTIYKDLPKALKLPASEMASFRQATNRANFQLAVLRSSNHLAMVDTASVTAASR